MISKEVVTVLRQYGIRKDELEGLYKRLIKQAKEYWRDDCIMDEQEIDLPYLEVQIGYNSERGLMGRVRWRYSYMNAEERDWYYAAQIDILADKLTPICAMEYLYEDTYYQRTGRISAKSKQEFLRNYPEHFNDQVKKFEQVVEDLAYGLT